MASQAALFQILYQNDTLYQLGESVVFKPEAIPAKIEEKPVIQEPKAAPILTTAKPQISEQPPKPVIPEPPKASFPDLQHKILVLTDDSAQKDLTATELTFLDNILKAVKSSAANADILNYSFLQNPDAREALAKKTTKYFITFGVPLVKLELDLLLVPYTPKLADGIWFLATDPLKMIEADRDLKKRLWQALQKMFENV